MSDVFDILEANRPEMEDVPVVRRGPKPKPPKPLPVQRRKPEGMPRELFALLNTSDGDAPLIPSDFAAPTPCYKQVRANLSIKKPRKWVNIPFLNPGRKDHLQLYHWRRVPDPNEPPKEYPFAKYNTSLDHLVPKYNDREYGSLLVCDQWTREETDYLMEMCSRFHLKFIVIHDRWDKTRFSTERSVEDLKERYYFIHNQLAKARAGLGGDPKVKAFDTQHERKRKQQLMNLYNRTKEQIEEETNLLNEMKKIEQKKKERERKTQDLQRIMDAAGRSAPEHRRQDTPHQPAPGRPHGSGMRGMPGRRPGRGAGRPSRDSMNASLNSSFLSGTAASLLEANTISIKFKDDFKANGASLRSHRLKLPPSLGTKKMKALETMINEVGLDLSPMPTEAICQSYNELRGDLLLLYDLKVNLANTNFEIESLKNQLAAAKPDLVPSAIDDPSTQDQSNVQSTPVKPISDCIDINAVNTPGRKRKAALEQSNVMRKLKKTL